MSSEDRVIYYDAWLGQLEGSQLSKARKLNKLGLIQEHPQDRDQWIIKPIPGYNSTTYIVRYDEEYQFYACNCQANKVEMRVCSHIIAVNLFLKLEREKDGIHSCIQIVSGLNGLSSLNAQG